MRGFGIEERLTGKLRELYDSHGYAKYRMSKFEEYDLYVKNKSFLLSDSVITFTDTTGKLLALKPDVTLSIVKNEGDVRTGVKKLYYNESVYRITGRTGLYREISQTGLECLGEIDRYTLSEVLELALQTLACVSSEHVLAVSHLGLLSLAMSDAGIAASERDGVLAYVSQKNRHDLIRHLDALGVPEARAAALLSLLSLSGDARVILPRLREISAGAEWSRAVEELSEVLSPLSGDAVRIDFSVIHDLSYYNGIVFGGYVAGVPECVLSGGQYDRLMERMGKRARAVGFAVYPDRLDALPAEDGLDVDTVVLYGEGDTPLAVAEAVRRHRERGERTLACRTLPEGLTYRSVDRLSDTEV